MLLECCVCVLGWSGVAELVCSRLVQGAVVGVLPMLRFPLC